MLISINPDNIDPRLIDEAVQALEKGKLIIFPTDSVYAIGCDLYNKKALNELARFKGVKLKHANFSIICTGLSNLSDYVKQIDRPTYKLLNRNLPGPFTFILKANNDIPRLFESNKQEVGIRIPENQIVIKLVERLGRPIATTSLHKEDDEIQEYFIDPYVIYERHDQDAEIIIDGGYGKLDATTIVDCTGDGPEIVRQGKGELLI